MSDIDLDALQEAWAVLDAAVDDGPGRSHDALITFSRAIDYLTVLKASTSSIASSSLALVQRAETAERERDALKAEMTVPTIEDGSQNWAALNGGVAYHLIERHAENWADVDKMMSEWAAAKAGKDAERYAAIKKMLPDLLAVAAQGGVNTDEAPEIFAHHIDSSKLDAGVDAWIAQEAGAETPSRNTGNGIDAGVGGGAEIAQEGGK